MAVVDQYGKVYGLEGLRIVDASIMPDCIRANTNVTTLAIGEDCGPYLPSTFPRTYSKMGTGLLVQGSDELHRLLVVDQYGKVYGFWRACLIITFGIVERLAIMPRKDCIRANTNVTTLAIAFLGSSPKLRYISKVGERFVPYQISLLVCYLSG